MRGIVLPAIADVRGPMIDVDVAIAPVAAATPVIAPAPDRPGRAECDAGRNHSRTDIGRIAPIVRRIFRIGPAAVDGRRIIVRHVHRCGIGLLDHDDLLAFLRLDADLLLLGGDQLLVVIGLGAQALDRIHHIGLLREKGVAELLGPVELVAHHGEDVGGAGQRLDAIVPALLVHLRLQRIALEALALFQPAVGLHDLQRIGRGSQHVRKQFVGIEGDRRDQGLQLFGLQKLGRRRSRRLRLRGGDRLFGRLGPRANGRCQQQRKHD